MELAASAVELVAHGGTLIIDAQTFAEYRYRGSRVMLAL
jgi:hypothetical protein